MLIAVERLLIKVRQPKSRADELIALRRRLRDELARDIETKNARSHVKLTELNRAMQQFVAVHQTVLDRDILAPIIEAIAAVSRDA